MATPTEDYYPDHDGGKFAPLEAATVATWKAPAFLENLAVDADGAVFVTVYSHKRVDRYDPHPCAIRRILEFHTTHKEVVSLRPCTDGRTGLTSIAASLEEELARALAPPAV